MVTGDLELLTKIAGEPGLEQHLQAAGEAVLSVRERLGGQDDETWRRIAESVATMLEARDWSGDGELAMLVRAPDTTNTSRRQIRADLDQLADLLEGSLDMGFGGVLDMQTGAVWPEAVLEDWPHDDPPPDPDEDPERYLFIPNEGSRDAWRDLHDFAMALSDDHIRDELLEAIDGKGAFGRFKRLLDRHEELWPVWQTYSIEARTGRARAWLYDAGYDAWPVRHPATQEDVAP